MESINVPEVKLDKEDGNSAVFVIEPFYPGYGTTVGNALRRVLLTSLPGAAVTAFKIVGVDHEFTTIDGIKEDMIDIMLNIKSLRFILHQEEPVTVTFKATKAGSVTGKDIKLPSSVELVNLEQPIATITGKVTLEAEIRIERGRGYVLGEDMGDKELPIGMIVVDAAFSPVRSCSIQVQNTRVGERVDYDKLTLEIETDGTVAPKGALEQASSILLDQIGIFSDKSADDKKKVTPEPVETPKAKTDIKPKADNQPKDFSIEEINLSIRTTNALVQNNIKKIKDILSIGREGLLEMKGVGDRAVTEIADKLEELGLEFN